MDLTKWVSHFLSRSRPDPESDCVLWTGCLTRGYGRTKVPRPLTSRLGVKYPLAYAHRVIYALVRGPLEEGKHLDHLCQQPLCCNPYHLQQVTPEVNAHRSNNREVSNWEEEDIW